MQRALAARQGEVCVSTHSCTLNGSTRVHIAGVAPGCSSAARPHSLSLTLSLQTGELRPMREDRAQLGGHLPRPAPAALDIDPDTETDDWGPALCDVCVSYVSSACLFLVAPAASAVAAWGTAATAQQ